jgi:hypothetical protein
MSSTRNAVPTLDRMVDDVMRSAELADDVLTIRVTQPPEARPSKIQIGQGRAPQQRPVTQQLD